MLKIYTKYVVHVFENMYKDMETNEICQTVKHVCVTRTYRAVHCLLHLWHTVCSP
jgi:hypothetical protein